MIYIVYIRIMCYVSSLNFPYNPNVFISKIYVYKLYGVKSMKEQFIQMKKTGVTNPSKAGFVSVTTNSSDMGDYLRKINSIKPLDVTREKELAVRAKNGDLFAKKECRKSALIFLLIRHA